jgi:hypothetical protein
MPIRDRFIVRPNRFGRYILVNWGYQRLAWSGSRWVEIDQDGMPLSVQVCNFESFCEAVSYGRKHIK